MTDDKVDLVAKWLHTGDKFGFQAMMDEIDDHIGYNHFLRYMTPMERL